MAQELPSSRCSLLVVWCGAQVARLPGSPLSHLRRPGGLPFVGWWLGRSRCSLLVCCAQATRLPHSPLSHLRRPPRGMPEAVSARQSPSGQPPRGNLLRGSLREATSRESMFSGCACSTQLKQLSQPRSVKFASLPQVRHVFNVRVRSVVLVVDTHFPSKFTQNYFEFVR